MDFSSLVLMEIDKETGLFIKELGSYKATDGAEYISKMYYDGEKINLFFNTYKDVEEWEYSAIFDLFNENVFKENGYIIEEVDDEYNPTWKVEFGFIHEHQIMENTLKKICSLIKKEMDIVFLSIKDKEEEYM
ncbi:DUF6762 family protein [Clostridium rectalis]|uniref:DUF6762 family protein n=1 Tax=Clostridium rectalis TaxID=2040295 RepID=UPI000F6369C5|nr:DUF6762 family protein [Clostridium rectalis]